MRNDFRIFGPDDSFDGQSLALRYCAGEGSRVFSVGKFRRFIAALTAEFPRKKLKSFDMAMVQQHPFTPVRPPRVRQIAKPLLSLTSLKAFEKCQHRERKLRRRNLIIFSAGIATIVATLITLPLWLG